MILLVYLRIFELSKQLIYHIRLYVYVRAPQAHKNWLNVL